MTDEKYNDLMKRCKRLDNNLSYAIAARQILKTADNDEFIEKVNNTYEAHVCNFLCSSARNEIILSLRRILEPDSKDRCSFKQLIKIRKKGDIESYIQSNIFNDNKPETNIEDFEKAYKKFEDDHFEIIEFIRNFRHYHLAHTLSNPSDDFFKKEGVKYSDLYNLLNRTCEIFEDFTRLVRVGCFDNASKNNVWDKYASKFWSSLTKGVAKSND